MSEIVKENPTPSHLLYSSDVDGHKLFDDIRRFEAYTIEPNEKYHIVPKSNCYKNKIIKYLKFKPVYNFCNISCVHE